MKAAEPVSLKRKKKWSDPVAYVSIFLTSCCNILLLANCDEKSLEMIINYDLQFKNNFSTLCKHKSIYFNSGFVIISNLFTNDLCKNYHEIYIYIPIDVAF